MMNNYPTNPSVVWSTNTITAPLPNATISLPQQITPDDVADYLGKMEFTRLHTTAGDTWQRKGQAGYMSWEQAVVYCLVKPWLG